MTSNRLVKTCVILALTYFSNFVSASFSKEMTLVGEIVSFDKAQVRIKSGKQEYIFSKEELDHPNYVVGQKIEIPFDENKVKQAMVKKVKPVKK